MDNISEAFKKYWPWMLGAGGIGLLYLWWHSRGSSGSAALVTPSYSTTGSGGTDTTSSGLSGVGTGAPIDTTSGLGMPSWYSNPPAWYSTPPQAQPTPTAAPTTPTSTYYPGSVAIATNPLAGFEINTSGVPYVTNQQFSYQTSQPLSAANVAASGKGGPNDLSGLAALNQGTGPNPAELAYFDAINAQAAAQNMNAAGALAK